MDYEDFKVFLAGVFVVAVVGLYLMQNPKISHNATRNVFFWLVAGSAFVIFLLPVLESFS